MSALEWAAIGVLAYVVLFALVLFVFSCLGAVSHAEDVLAEEEVAANAHPKGNIHVVPSTGWDYPPRGGKPRG